jgi:hypothetical protein
VRYDGPPPPLLAISELAPSAYVLAMRDEQRAL